MDCEAAITRWLSDAACGPLGLDATAVLRGLLADAAIAYVTELFERSETWFRGVPDEDVAWVLRFFVDGNESNYGPRCVAPQLPLARRERYLLAVRALFASTILPRLARTTSRGDAGPPSPLRKLCLGWWATCPMVTRTGPTAAEIDARLAPALWDVLHDIVLRPGDDAARSAAAGLLEHVSVPGSVSALQRVLRDLPRRGGELPDAAARDLFAAIALAGAAWPADV